MAFFTTTLKARITANTQKALEELATAYPDKYYNISHVIRVAILQLHRKEIPNSGIKSEFKTRDTRD